MPASDFNAEVHAQRNTGLVVFFGLFMAITRMMFPVVGDEVQAPHLSEEPAIRSTVNPNSAPWWELAVLSGLGESKSKAIVAFREAGLREQGPNSTRPVFSSLADLDRVRGIGPKGLARMAHELRFQGDP